MKNNRLYLALLVLGTAFWGISFPLVKEGLSAIQPHTFLTYRFLLAAIILSVIFIKYLRRINLLTIKVGVLLSLPLIFAIMMQTVSLKYTSSSNAAFIAGMDVLLIPIFKFFFFKKSIPFKTWFACSIALIGLYIISMASSTGFGYGDLLAIFGAVAFAIYILLVSRFSHKNIETPIVVVVQLYSCAIVSFLFMLIKGTPNDLIFPMNTSVLNAILFTSILATAFMYYIQNISQKYIEEEKIALTYLCEPIFATIAAYVLIGEPITVKTIIGGTLIVTALFIAEYKFKYLGRIMASKGTKL